MIRPLFVAEPMQGIWESTSWSLQMALDTPSVKKHHQVPVLTGEVEEKLKGQRKDVIVSLPGVVTLFLGLGALSQIH